MGKAIFDTINAHPIITLFILLIILAALTLKVYE
jgi:hypothetical protein